MEISPTTCFNDQEHAEDLIKDLIEDGHDQDEMKEFIETHGHKNFVLYYEDYARMVDEYDQETVDAFIEVFDLMDVLPDMPYWIAIDWEETWSNLEWDYTECNGYIFCNNW